MACLAAYDETPLKEQESLCASGLPFLCKKLPDAWRAARGLESGRDGQPATLGEAAHKTLQAAPAHCRRASTSVRWARCANWTSARMASSRVMDRLS